MDDIAEYIRIFEATPTDDFVEKRKAAIKTVATKLGKKNAFDSLLALANDVTAVLLEDDISESAICKQMASALSSKSASFSAKDNPLQIRVCAALTILKLLREAPPANGKVTIPVFLALTVWSGLTYRKPTNDHGLENLISEIIETARTLTVESAESSRRRQTIPAIKLQEPATEEDDYDLSAIEEAAEKTITALTDNAALDREELDLLWWVLGDWSDVAEKQLNTMSHLSRSIVCGIEISEILRRIPSNSHRNLVIRGIVGKEQFTVESVMSDLGSIRFQLQQHLNNNKFIKNNQAVLPLLNEICNDSSQASTNSAKYNAVDWGARALLEGAIIRIVKLPTEML